MSNIISDWIKNYKIKQTADRKSFARLMKRFDSPRFTKKGFEQGEKIHLTNIDFDLIYLYSQMDEDYFLRLDTNQICVLPETAVKIKETNDGNIQETAG